MTPLLLLRCPSQLLNVRAQMQRDQMPTDGGDVLTLEWPEPGCSHIKAPRTVVVP